MRIKFNRAWFVKENRYINISINEGHKPLNFTVIRFEDGSWFYYIYFFGKRFTSKVINNGST